MRNINTGGHTMSTNIDRAAEVIYQALNGKYGDFGNQGETARALADAGLLTPDLPQPTWEHTDIWVVDDLDIEAIGDSVNLEWSDEMDDLWGTTTRSLNLDRRMVLAILAASNRTKEESNHD